MSSQLNDYLNWPHLGQVFRPQLVVQQQKVGSSRFGIASLNAACLLTATTHALIPQSWHIENRLHYVCDVTFGEYECSIRYSQRQSVVVCLNNVVIGLWRQTDFTYVPVARHFFALHCAQALNLLR